jgi:threonine/homoserine/homoserine lactone efflux protein
MNHNRIGRIILASLAIFFLAVLVVIFHPDDNTLLLRSRSICKVKTSIPGSAGKSRIDSAPAVTVVSLDFAAIVALSAAAVHEDTAIFISSQVVDIWPNKAPPARS